MAGKRAKGPPRKDTPKKKPKGERISGDFAGACQRWEEGPLKERLSPGGEMNPKFRAYSGLLQEETREHFFTGGGEIEVKRLYTPLDLEGTDPLQDIGFPGQFPFTRGRDPVGGRAFQWPLNFYSGFGSSESANERYRGEYRPPAII